MSEFIPTADGAEQVLRAARRRRTAKATASGSSALLVAVALVFTTSGGGRVPEQDRLVTTTPSPTVSPSPAPSVGSAPTAAPRGGSQQVVPTQVPTLYPSPTKPAQTPPPQQRQSSAKRYVPITRTTGTIESTDLCTDGTADQYRTVCTRTLDPGPIKRGTTVQLGGEVCNYPTSEPLALTFASTAEVQLQIDPYEGQEKWHAGEGYTYSKPGPTATIAPGQCLRWSAPWNTRDHEGFVVPPGSYQLNFYVQTKTEPGYLAFRTITVVN